MHTIDCHWLPSERAAWRPAERLLPAAWAERWRVLTRAQSARPGRWRNANAPYLAGLMDLCTRRGVEEITICKAAQVGVSEALRNLIGYMAHQQPDPLLLVLPDEQTGRRIVAQRILPLLRDTACLRDLFTPASRDVQLRHITLANGFTLRLGWSGSAASLAADPCRVVINDEVDKFQPWSGREADPISLGYARTQTY
jgi:phage terminase large subunit GpA-like protein